jgi:hypothetical protein
MSPADIQLIELLAPIGEKLIEDVIGLIEKHKQAGTQPSAADVQATVNTSLSATVPQVSQAIGQQITAAVQAATPAPATPPTSIGVTFHGSTPTPDVR